MNAETLDECIRRAQAGEPEAFDHLIDAYAPRVYGYLFRMTGHADDAEELMQEVFVRLVRMIAQYEHDGRFEAWLFRVAANLARDRARRKTAGPRFVPLQGSVKDGASAEAGPLGAYLDLSSPPPDAPMLLGEEVDRLQSALAQIPTVEREVIMLRHFGDLTFSEIAKAMNTPLGTALARAHRGLKRLREIMEPKT